MILCAQQLCIHKITVLIQIALEESLAIVFTYYKPSPVNLLVSSLDLFLGTIL